MNFALELQNMPFAEIILFGTMVTSCLANIVQGGGGE